MQILGLVKSKVQGKQIKEQTKKVDILHTSRRSTGDNLKTLQIYKSKCLKSTRRQKRVAEK